ncbi:MAG: ABC transporter ATP-binding protein [Phycisphaerales bacterium]
MSDDAISISAVTKTFGQKRAVDNLDLRVPTGSVCGFLGPNGAGKTTTIRMVMSIFPPDSGQISVLGHGSALEAKDKIGYLPEERGVYRKMRVGDFIGFIAKLKGLAGPGLNKRIDDWLERVELPDVRKKRCEELSKGMQQKVQFLAAIIHEPELIILDEPFSGLDPVNARLLRSLINDLHAEGRTIIFSTHVLSAAEQICDRVFMINRGKKVLDGSVEKVRERFDPKTIVVECLPGQDGLAEMVGAVDGVHSVSSMGDRDGAVEAHLDDHADPQDVMKRVLATAPVQGVRLRRATLEDIFVSLVKPGDSEDSLRAALGAGDAQEEASGAATGI